MPSTYSTSGGDMWDSISFKLFGSEFYSDTLIALNPDLKDVVEFDVGMTINVPDIAPVTQTINPVPWKTINIIPA